MIVCFQQGLKLFHTNFEAFPMTRKNIHFFHLQFASSSLIFSEYFDDHIISLKNIFQTRSHVLYLFYWIVRYLQKCMKYTDFMNKNDFNFKVSGSQIEKWVYQTRFRSVNTSQTVFILTQHKTLQKQDEINKSLNNQPQ